MKCADQTCKKQVGGTAGHIAFSMRCDDGDDLVGTAVEARFVLCAECGKKMQLGIMTMMGVQAQELAGRR